VRAELFGERGRATSGQELYGHTARLYGKSKHMNALAQLVCSGVRAEVLRVLFGLGAGELHLREIQRRTGFAIGTVQQDLGKLVKMGLVKRRADGNRVCYSANSRHPLHTDIRRMVLKTVGLADVLARRLRDDRIRCAFVFGSVAAGTDKPESDIDLMVIGNITLRKVCALLSGLGNQLEREVNPHVIGPTELHKRAAEQDHFVTSVLASPRVFVVGTEDELDSVAGQRLAQTTHD
jgi:predicted nucleotidyltransferase/DNA-binding HxlR family transcriptional regulator